MPPQIVFKVIWGVSILYILLLSILIFFKKSKVEDAACPPTARTHDIYTPY
jgi:hypothetical protein